MRAPCWPPGCEVAAIEPGLGVRLAGGELVRARAVVVERRPDPDARPGRAGCGAGGRRPGLRVEGRRLALREPGREGELRPRPAPDLRRRRRPARPVYRAQVEIGRGIDATQAACDAARGGEPAPEWCELYFQTPVRPVGRAAGCPHDERLLAVRAARARVRDLGRAARRDRRRRARGRRPLRPRRRRAASSNGRCSGRPTSRRGSA